jgi:ATP-binding cassette subfamily F protein 3
MAILTFTNLGQSFGAEDIFGNASASLANDGKVGLVGPNGIGKTSLLLILAGLREPTSGSVHRARGRRIGYLPQEAAGAFADEEVTVYDEMLAIFAELQRDEARLRQLENEIAAGDAADDLLERYGSALERFEHAGGYEYEVRIKQVLDGLGFAESDRDLKLGHLSGGQKTRALLARLLLEEPDLLILDEPTNHLDVQAIEWLEGALRIWDGAILVVSHDRYFLDRVVNAIWELRPDGIESYRGNYSAYVDQRRERWAQRQQAFESQRAYFEKELDYIRRNIAGQRTQMAKGKLSRISRELDAIQRGGLDAIQGKSWSKISNDLGGTSRRMMSVAEAAAAVKQLSRPDASNPAFMVELKAAHRSGDIVLRATDLEVGFPGTSLFHVDNIRLNRLECAALVGPNGAGKTTFLRTILGKLPPLAGEVRLGASLRIGYFAQAHEQLIAENKVIDEILRHRHMPTSEARAYLGRFLFSGDDAFKPVETLSGGERGRLALAILALEQANFLLLDEPTNHLDIPAQEMLQAVLDTFDGTILLVTHDRYLVDHLATQLWLLEGDHLRVFEGPYQEYLAVRDQEAEQDRLAAAARRDAARVHHRQRQADGAAKKKRAQRLAEVEALIAEFEEEQDQIARALQAASEAEALDKIQRLSLEYAASSEQLETLLHEWEDLARE